MKELRPLTISASIKNRPTVLLTQEYERFVLYQPFSGKGWLNFQLKAFLYQHYKIEMLRTGFFTFQEKKYLCHEMVDGSVLFIDWWQYQWRQKRQFNRFLKPRALFYMYLIDFLFPVFEPSKKWIIPGFKDRFMGHPFPAPQLEQLRFQPMNISQVGLNSVGARTFFRHIKNDLPLFLEDFMALHHDKLRADLKYRIRLSSEYRNHYWNAFQQCFDEEFINYAVAAIKNYMLQL